jgi:hypothetical protein
MIIFDVNEHIKIKPFNPDRLRREMLNPAKNPGAGQAVPLAGFIFKSPRNHRSPDTYFYLQELYQTTYIFRKFGWLLPVMVMKKNITCSLLGMIMMCMLRAQDNSRTDIENISTPYIYFNEVSASGQNYLFDKEWVKAKLLAANNSIVSNDSFLFNFDKIDQRLLVTTDFKKVYQIDWREFKAILFYWHDTAYVFKHIYFVSNKDLFQVLINGKSKYSLYKTVHTKVVKGSYGATSFGRSSDKYLDVPEYCILFPDREYRMVHFLKRSAIERIFKLNPDSEIVDDYLNMTGKKELYNENDLMQLIVYLNKSSL